MIREKKTVSGPLLEADFYPVWKNGAKMPTRAPKTNPSTKEQAKYNELMATKKVIRLVNYNFNKVDYYAHLTYRPREAPQDEKQARKDINNYLRRMKRRREKELDIARKRLKEAKDDLARLKVSALLEDAVKYLTHRVKLLRKPLKYIYSIERVEYKSGEFKGQDRNWHFHMFISGGLSTEMMRNMWQDTGTATFDYFRPDMFGPEAAAKYIVKDPQGRKRFVCSRTIKQPPKPKTKDGRVSRRQVEKMSTERDGDRKYWEKRYKGYRFVKSFPRFNQYNGHWYLSVIMYKADGGDPPPWKWEEWNTECG